MQRVLGLLLFFCPFIIIAQDTELKLYRPFEQVEEQVTPIIKSRLPGECFAQSQLILREDAWRCQAYGKTFDPCFAKMGPGQKNVLCLSSPWTNEGIQIDLSQPLNNEHQQNLDMSRAFPWAIELINGERCIGIETQELYDSMPIRYRCGAEHFLMGYLQRCKSLWSMLEKTSKGVVTMDLSKAWF